MTRLTISRALTLLAAEHPHRVAVRDGEVVLTRRELDLASNRLARAFAAQGIEPDDLVTLRLPNSAFFVVAACAVWKLGATPQPLSPRLPDDEALAVIAAASPALVVTEPVDAAAFSSDPLPDAAAASWKAPTSSGSTGRPKIVLAAASARVDPHAPTAVFLPTEQVQLVAGPLYHSAPFTYAMRGLMTGHELVLLPRFDEEDWFDAIERHRVTWAMLVPTTMGRLARHARFGSADLTSLETLLHLGAPCPPGLKREWIDRIDATRVVEVYAGSESQGITVIRGDEWLEHPGSVGRPAAGSEMKVVDASGADAAVGVVGEILMRRSGGATYRYLGASTVLRDGWDSLGDTGWMDADGYLHVVDRLDDLILTGGANVWPSAVEERLGRHPAVRSVVVFGLPDADLGQRVHAIVDIADAPEPDLLAWGRAHLDPESRPRSIEFVRSPVRDDAGKARRALLRAARTPG